MAETITVRKWIVSRIAANAPLTTALGGRVYFGIAPQGAADPYMVMQLQSPGNDLLALGAYRIWADTLWLLKVVKKGASGLGLESIVDQLDALFHNTSATTPDGSIWSSVREGPFDQVEVDGGDFYVSVGGFYRIKVRDS